MAFVFHEACPARFRLVRSCEFSKDVNEAQRLGWPPAWADGARISGQNKKRSGVAAFEIQQWRICRGAQVWACLAA